MIINSAKLLELGACIESRCWIGAKEYPYTPDGVRAALAAGAELGWLMWLLKETRCVAAEMWELAGVRIITENAKVTFGGAVCVSGSPTITVSGGEVIVSGNATPTIVVSGGEVRVFGDAKPTITVSSGAVLVYGNAKPTIAVSGGEVGVYDDATPTINMSGGWVVVPGRAKPTISMSGGEVIASGNAKPIVRHKDGTEIEPVVGVFGRRTYRV